MVAIPLIPSGCQVIPLYQNVSGDNFRPKNVIIDYVIVDGVDFQWINQHQWFRKKSVYTGDYYAKRIERQGKKRIVIDMAREILGLPRGAGWGGNEADHIDHNTLNNRRENLRVATHSQNGMNRRKIGSCSRFKCAHKNGNKYRASITVNRSMTWFFGISTEVEAALTYNYAANLVYGEYAELNIVPDDEMPTYERQWELYDKVITRLKEKKVTFDESKVVQR